jgi:FkbM family methyltransferase
MFHSQVGQDNWVCEKLKYKKDGFFIDVGACDGIWYSNTHYLEKQLNWNGICVEADILKFNELLVNRTCTCVNKAVYRYSGSVEFARSNEIFGVKKDLQFPITPGTECIVETISMEDLLDHYGSPKLIDYISLDTEGGDYDVLLGFPFNRYDVKLWTIEHNAYADGGVLRESIRGIMLSNGYKVVKNTPANVEIFEDWFINDKYVK